ncbi:MAG: NADH-quinone oxidoreductase subunit NuoG [Gammaproteobacteria bacterium]|nr:NADH-quinone oxidoreductase subunit NuoG [Gammaproteobacteria bacterium]
MNAQVQQDMVTIEIDGRKVEAPKGSMIIEAADRIGIDIPRFCYHRKLSIAANCRMCLVDVEKAPKPMPACATPVADGMRVFTESCRARDAQKNVMEFLLINHPLDCPICDQGGECELQDLAMGYGRSVSRFTERKRAVKDKNLGPLISTDMTRCIHCTRCVRFLDEIAGSNELGTIGRGEKTEISTYIEHSIDSELSGNIIDLCPVGALTNKPFRFRARSWEMLARPAVSSHDCLHSNIWYHTRRGEVLRAVPRDNEAINETWLSDRDRYSHSGLQHANRLLQPQLRNGERWQQTSWEQALEQAVTALQQAGDSVQMLLSPQLVCEEQLAFRHWADQIGAAVDWQVYDHAVADGDQPAQNWSHSNVPLAALERADAVLLAGARIHHDQPMLGHRLRQAQRRHGASINVLTAAQVDWYCRQDSTVLAAPDQWAQHLAGILLALQPDYAGQSGFKTLMKAARRGPEEEQIAQRLQQAERAVVIAGQQIAMHPQAGLLQYLLRLIAEASGSGLTVLAAGGNAAGAMLMHDGAERRIDAPKVLILHSLQPLCDTARPEHLHALCQQADTVIALSAWRDDDLEQLADIMLPVADNIETGGTSVNLNGLSQTFAAAARAPGSARPGWKIARRLAESMSAASTPADAQDASLLQWNDDDAVRQAVANRLQALREGVSDAGSSVDLQAVIHQLPEKPASMTLPKSSAAGQLYRLGELPMVRVDQLCRHSAALQASAHQVADRQARLHPDDLRKLKLNDQARVLISQGDARAEATVVADAAVASGCIGIALTTALAAELGAAFGPVSLQPAADAQQTLALAESDAGDGA